jgi:hypothetical protein
LEKTDSGWIFRDWRFGELRQSDGSFESVFLWNVTPLQDNTGYSLARRRAPFTTEAVNDLQKNLLGME